MCDLSGGTAADRTHFFESFPHTAGRRPAGRSGRTALEGRLAEAFRRARRRAAIPVIFCDIDGVDGTDHLGPPASSDRVVAEVARRLRGGLRPGDAIARVDRYGLMVVLDEGAGEGEVRSMCLRLEDHLAAPPGGGTPTISVRLTSGLAFAEDPLVRDPAPPAPGMPVLPADLALYQRKDGGPTGSSDVPLARLRELSGDLLGAADRGEITVLYQPLVDPATAHVVAVEALARWAHPRIGIIGPDEFIPIAEMNGEIAGIGRAVRRRACSDVARMRASHPHLELAVNISVDELGFPDFIGDLRDVLDSFDLPPQALTVELTESKLPKDRLAAARRLSEVRALGVGIALDDFGTGYTSLVQLRDLPVTEIKVDRSFVNLQGPASRDLLSGIVGLAHGLGLRTVAEGVCSEEDLVRVREAGFDRGQGFGLGRPVGMDVLARHLYDATS